jgi:hypothetical protein
VEPLSFGLVPQTKVNVKAAEAHRMKSELKFDLRACLGFGVLCAVSGFSASPSMAGEVSVIRMSPSVIVTPESSVTTTTRTIEGTPSESLILTPVSPYLADETISRRTVIVGDRPASGATTTSISSSLDKGPHYGERLRLLREQLDKGTNRGWINAQRAAQLSTRLAELEDRNTTVRNSGYLKVDCDSFEKELTGYNIELSHSMEGHNM